MLTIKYIKSSGHYNIKGAISLLSVPVCTLTSHS